MNISRVLILAALIPATTVFAQGRGGGRGGGSAARPAGGNRPAGGSIARPAGGSIARPAGGGIARPAGGGIARPAGGSIARPAESGSRPGGGTVPGSRPDSGVRPSGGGTRPDSGVRPSGGGTVPGSRPDSGVRPSGGGTVPGSRPDSGVRPSGGGTVPGSRPDSEVRPSGGGTVPGSRPDSGVRPSGGGTVPGSRPDSGVRPSGGGYRPPDDGRRPDPRPPVDPFYPRPPVDPFYPRPPVDPYYPGRIVYPGRPIDPFDPGYPPAPVIIVPRPVEIISPVEVVEPVVIPVEAETATGTVQTVEQTQTAAVAAAPVKAGDYQVVPLEDTSEDATPAVCYKPGQDMKFSFSVNKLVETPVEGKLYLRWKRSGDDGKTEQGRVEIDEEKAVSLVTSIDRPGFVRIEASLEDEAGNDLKSVFNGGAGVELEKLAQAVAEPADFDEYWAKQKKLLDDVELLPEIKPIRAKQEGFDAYEVKVPCAGPRPVTGYLIIPSGATAKSLPAKVHFQAYGVRDQSVPDGVPGMIYFDVNAHGIELSQPKSYYDGIRAQLGHYGYNNEENKTPDTSYFRYMAVRTVRALQFVKLVEAWNGKDLGVIGYSQGGLQAAWAAGLVPEVTHAEIGMPWCTDVGCEKAGRQRGTCPDYQPGLDYFDPVNHIKRASAACLVDIVRAGLGDYVAQPSGVAVLFNNAPGRKRVIYYQNCAHAEPNALSTAIVMQSDDWPAPAAQEEDRTEAETK